MPFTPPTEVAPLLALSAAGGRIADWDAPALARVDDLAPLTAAAASRRDAAFGGVQTYSRKVFIPLTQLCRDVCHYCTFAQPPRREQTAFLAPDTVLDIARRGAAAGCREALFTLGDRPERRYAAARRELDRLGHATTLSYLEAMAERVFSETGLLPHLNPGIMAASDIAALRRVSVSMGLMLESGSARLMAPGGPHHGSPDKEPSVRLATLARAGEAAVPFTTGLLIGIGETREERIADLLAIRALGERYGHIQEVIVQNFRAKPGTRMARAGEPSLDEHLWTIAVARLLLGPEISIQAPPNLRPGVLASLIDAGIDDWGGVSPVTPDHVNPEAPWPQLDQLAEATAAAGRVLVERLAIRPAYARDADRWLDGRMAIAVRRSIDAAGLARSDRWQPGAALPIPLRGTVPVAAVRGPLARILARARDGQDLTEDEIVSLFGARGADEAAVMAAADALRREAVGDTVRYVVNRNVNYTNVCTYHCGFCAFSKGRVQEDKRGRPYALDLGEIGRRAAEAWARGATEICLQGGIHPAYTGQTYLDVLAAVKAAAPGLHVHAFTPLEVSQGAATLGIDVRAFLTRLQVAGLGSLPGTAAEILDDPIRAIICPDKLDTDSWLSVMESAHDLGLRSTATIMFGHVDGPANWARHLLRLRALQQRTGGFTEFVPLPFVAMEAPLYLRGRSRAGPTFREAMLMHAIARLALFPGFVNIQASWVKMGPDGLAACLAAGANDAGGTLMNESITRAAGATHGQEMPPATMAALIRSAGRQPQPRTTLYGAVDPERTAAAESAIALEPIVERPAAWLGAA